MIPKNFLHLFSKLSLKKSKEDEKLNIKYLSYLTNSGKYTDPDEPLALQVDTSTLSTVSYEKIYVLFCLYVVFLITKQLKFFKKNWKQI